MRIRGRCNDQPSGRAGTMLRLIAGLVLLAPLSAMAVPFITLSGDFAGANLGSPSTVQVLAGTWSTTYDAAAVNPTGNTFLAPPWTL